jgi:hypothetical protein
MATADLTLATGGPAMVKAAYGSGKPAYGVGAGNATMVVDETANVEEAARNTRMSKTNDFGSGCSAEGNLLVESSIYDAMLQQLRSKADAWSTNVKTAAPGRVLGRRAPHAGHHRAARRSSLRQPGLPFPMTRHSCWSRAAHRDAVSLLDGKARNGARGFQVSRIRHGSRDGRRILKPAARSFLRHLFVRRRPHPPPGAGR